MLALLDRVGFPRVEGGAAWGRNAPGEAALVRDCSEPRTDGNHASTLNRDGMIRRRHYEPDTDWETLIAALVEAWTPSGPQSIWYTGEVSRWVRQAWDTVPFVWEDDTG